MENLLAYTAGYIDGDGCFYIGKNIKPIKYRSAIIISSSNKEICKFFKKSFGGNCAFKKKSIKHPFYRPMNQWYIQGKNGLNFAHSMLPYLIEKRKDAETFVSFHGKQRDVKDNLIKEIRNHRNEENLVSISAIEYLNSIKNTIPIISTDYAYLAGFIDAECCLTIGKYKPPNRPNYTYKITLHCNNTKVSTIKWIIERFGGYCGFVSRKNKNPKHKDQIYWRLTSKALFSILPNLIPFLRIKKNVGERLIEFGETILKNGGDRQKEEFKNSYNSIIQKRELIIDQIHLLNSKGC